MSLLGGEGRVFPSISLVLANAPDKVIAAADAALQRIATRYEILCSGAPQRLIDQFQWLWSARDFRSALQAATGDLVIIASAAANFSELALLVPWTAECSLVYSTEQRGWWNLWHSATPHIAVIRRGELRKLLAMSNTRCDLGELLAAARRVGVSMTAPRMAA